MRNKRNFRKKSVEFWSRTEDQGNDSEGAQKDIWRKLEALDSMFAESKHRPEWFHQIYVQPLLDEGVSLETAFDLLVASAVRAN